MKNGTSKSDNVDAYFVDTLNKSMAESVMKTSHEQMLPSVDVAISTNHIEPCNEYHEYAEQNPPTNRSYTPNKITPSNKTDSSSDSCGSNFAPVKSTMSDGCHSAPLDLDQFSDRPARSSSMCSMPELVNCSFPHYIMNSESMPNITSNGRSRKLLYASQLNSSTSLSESDNMSEQSGYVSSCRSSAGSTNQVSPAGKHYCRSRRFFY